MEKIRINLYDLLISLSKSGDLVTPLLTNHHQKVAYLSYKLAEELGFSERQQFETLLAALVHDIGAMTKEEKLELVHTEQENVHHHAFRGANLLKEFAPLQDISDIIRYHHVPWDYGKGQYYKGYPISMASHIIHLADRVCIIHSIDNHTGRIGSEVTQRRDSIFIPELTDCLIKLLKIDYIWLDLNDQEPLNKIPELSETCDIISLEIDNLVEISHIFSHIIDFRSRFTARHSAGVAKTAERLSELFSFSPYEKKLILIAGYLHDLGKLAIDNSILEKPGKLTEQEISIVRSHTYYTYQWLKPIKQFHTINLWASFHHEKLNGNGYPFHIKGDNLTLGSRIMAVADVFTAIAEDRPYREGMNRDKTVRILTNMVTDGSLDENVVNVLIDNYEQINDLRIKAQALAYEKYKSFTDNV